MKRLLAIQFLFLATISFTAAQDCGTRKMDPRIAAFLNLIEHDELTIEELRQIPIEAIKNSGPPLRPYPAEDVQRLKITADSIQILVFNPSKGKKLPIIINYHGGGFISPLLPGLEYSLWAEAKTFNAIVVAVDYRVAPEHKFPAAVNDSYNAFQWVVENGDRIGGDKNKIILLGNSAGANLVAVIAQMAKDAGISNRIRLQVMNGLPADLRPENMETSTSYQVNAKGYFQSKAMCYFAVELYAPGDYNNPKVSPILTKDLSNLPPAVIITAEFDPLRDDGIMYAKRLRMSGVKVYEKCFAGQIHCLIGLPEDAKEWNDYVMLIKTAMEENLPK